MAVNLVDRGATSANPDRHVFITVSGGVAYVAEAPAGVEIHVLDFDDLKADFEGAFRGLSPEARSFYFKMERRPGGSAITAD